jgi:starch phosphorylase
MIVSSCRGETVKITPFNVMPRVPEALEPLRDIAFNIWFSWNWEAVQLLIRLDPEYWEKTYQNPTLMLGVIPQERFDAVAQDDSFIANMQRVHTQLADYMASPTWFAKTHPESVDRRVAYFSMEYAIDVGLPIYSGGLGVLAGDHLKSASDLGIPLIAVGLLYREGYLQQHLTADGWQQEAYPINDWYNMPVTIVTGDDQPGE